MSSEVSFTFLNTYLVEGVVELDPMADRMTIRTVDPNGNPFNFDLQKVLRALHGQEVRVIVAPLVAVRELEQMVQAQQAQGESVVVGEPPAEGGKIELAASLKGGKGGLTS